jgi:hypothetical protein
MRLSAGLRSTILFLIATLAFSLAFFPAVIRTIPLITPARPADRSGLTATPTFEFNRIARNAGAVLVRTHT